MVQVAVAVESGFQVFSAVKAIARQYLTDPAVKAVHHAFGVRAAHGVSRCSIPAAAQSFAEHMLATGGASLALEPVGGRFVVIGE